MVKTLYSILHRSLDLTKEFKTVMNYVADEANRKQRKLVGLDK
ncbi:hypothetical protein [Enterococcus faecium]